MGFMTDRWEYSLGPLPAPQWLPFDPQSPPVAPLGQQFNLLVRYQGQMPARADHYWTVEVTRPDGTTFRPRTIFGTAPGESGTFAVDPGQLSGEAFFFIPELPGSYQARVTLYGR